MKYSAYLQSDHWRELKKEKARKRPTKCAICGATDQIDCHHVLYRNWFDVQTSDLRWLCRKCHDLVHQVIHEVRPQKKKRNNPQALWILTQHAVWRLKRKMTEGQTGIGPPSAKALSAKDGTRAGKPE